jgi:rod shape-determining protein MreD
MNRFISFVFLFLVSIIFLILQTTILSPRKLGVFSPDLNLILIVFLALFFEVRVGAIIALGSAYMTDVLSGYLIGIHTLSRFAVFTVLKGFSENLYAQSKFTQAMALFLSTLFSWFFVWVVLKMRTDVGFGITPGLVMAQGLVNTVLGLSVFWLIGKANARV